jgi:hypothetical protein
MNKNLNLKNKLIYNLLIKLVFALLFLLPINSLRAQFNLKIAYNLDYSAFQSHNGLLEQYNEANPWLATEFGQLRFLNGVQLGARVRNEILGLDFSWERSSAKRSAAGINFSDISINQELDYRLNRFSLALETYAKNVGLGANITWENFIISNTVSGLEAKNEILAENRFGNRIYLILQTKGTERLALSLQPYIYIPWSHYNISPLASFLNSNTDEFNIQQNFHFGLSLVFYNGPQRN